MAGPRTTWEDLTNLGWHKQQVYNTLNAQRGNTMQGFGDIALNETFALTYSWYCYNVIRGTPRQVGGIPNTINSTETIWTYDNSQNFQPFETSVTESWTESASASLSITTSASVSLGVSINIGAVASSEFNISISTESTTSETRERTYSLSQSWPIVVGPGEIVTIERTKTTTTGNATYYQDFGLHDSSLIATKGNSYNSHYYWGFNANRYLNTPLGTMILNGYSEKTNFGFRITRTGGMIRGKETLELPQPTFVSIRGGGRSSEKVTYAEPGSEFADGSFPPDPKPKL